MKDVDYTNIDALKLNNVFATHESKRNAMLEESSKITKNILELNRAMASDIKLQNNKLDELNDIMDKGHTDLNKNISSLEKILEQTSNYKLIGLAILQTVLVVLLIIY